MVRFADTIGYHSRQPAQRLAVSRLRHSRVQRQQAVRPVHARATRRRPAARSRRWSRKWPPASTGCCSRPRRAARSRRTTKRGMLTDRVRAVGDGLAGADDRLRQCHDHKFDPITTARLLFARRVFRRHRGADHRAARRRHCSFATEAQSAPNSNGTRRKLVAAARKQELDGLEEQSPDSGRSAEAGLPPLKKARADFEATVPRALIIERAREPRDVRILPRGNWMDESGEVVDPALPAFLVQAGGDSTATKLNRLDLANWLVSRENPLTARMVSQPNVEAVLRHSACRRCSTISARRANAVEPRAARLAGVRVHGQRLGREAHGAHDRHERNVSPDLDPMRQLSPNAIQTTACLARQSRWRLEAELVRDNALCHRRSARPTIGGPSVKPYQPDGYWENLNFPPRTYEASTGPSQYRRGLYTWWQRTFLHPSMVAFDAPSREECAADRSRSNIPQQALVLLNDPTYVEAARAFAARILREGSGDENAAHRLGVAAGARPNSAAGRDRHAPRLARQTPRAIPCRPLRCRGLLERGSVRSRPPTSTPLNLPPGPT